MSQCRLFPGPLDAKHISIATAPVKALSVLSGLGWGKCAGLNEPQEGSTAVSGGKNPTVVLFWLRIVSLQFSVGQNYIQMWHMKPGNVAQVHGQYSLGKIPETYLETYSMFLWEIP